MPRDSHAPGRARLAARLLAVTTLGTLAALAAPARAADVSIGLNDTTIELGYTSAPVGQGLEFTAGAFHKRDKGDDGDILSLGLQLAQPLAPGVRAALGGKVLAGFNDAHDAAGLALGGLVDLSSPAFPMLHFGLHGWFAPGITSFGSSESWRDLGAAIGYEVIPNAQIVLSHRSVRTEYGRGSKAVTQKATMLGLKLTF